MRKSNQILWSGLWGRWRKKVNPLKYRSKISCQNSKSGAKNKEDTLQEYGAQTEGRGKTGTLDEVHEVTTSSNRE